MSSIAEIPNRREFCRVDTYLPLEYRLITTEERPLVRSRISGEVLFPDFALLPPSDDPLMQSLSLLDKKLDAVLRLLSLQCNGFHALPFRYVSLSGNGMRFSSHGSFSCGDAIEFKVILTLNVPMALYLYGEVIRVEKQTDGYSINVRFLATDDSLCDLVVRYVFEQERRMLREKRG